MSPNTQTETKCAKCNRELHLTSSSISRNKRKNGGVIICKDCKRNDPTYKENLKRTLILRNKSKAHKQLISEKIKDRWDSGSYDFIRNFRRSEEGRKYQSKITKEAWNDSNYRKLKLKQNRDISSSDEVRNKISISCKEKWNDLEYRYKVLKNMDKHKISICSKANWADEDYKIKMIKIIKENMKNPEILDKIREKSKKIWKDDSYRQKMFLALENQKKVSELQERFYSVLDDLDVRYYREYNDRPDDKEVKFVIKTSDNRIVYYSFDCVIPKQQNMDKNLLIEVQGGPHYFDKTTITKDKIKAKHVDKYLSSEYDLKYIWSHDFKCEEKITGLIKYWLGISKIELADFEFEDISVKPINNNQCKSLLSKYHYLPNFRSSRELYGAFYKDELVAVCVFSPLPRQNITIDNYNKNEVCELSRFCIHPKYQKKNFASWFISRCIKMINYKCIIAYADATFNHNGTIYKALGFEQDKVVKSDYWYTDPDNNIISKRSVYGYARNLDITENEFAEQFGFTKVCGMEKYRFILRLS